MRLTFTALVLLGVAAGCTQPLPIEGAPCPCPDSSGFRCDQATNRCVPADAKPARQTPVEPPSSSGGSGGASASGAGGASQSPPSTFPKECKPPRVTVPRPLDPIEYANTVKDLLGVVVDTSALPDLEELPGLTGYGQLNLADEKLVKKYTGLAAQVAAAAPLATVLPQPCLTNTVDPSGCARMLAATLGPRAYRRPLDSADIDELVAGSGGALRPDNPTPGYRALIQQMLASKKFYVREEIGESSGPRSDVRWLTPWEVATRLSYFLWATMPDQELTERAAAGRLRTAGDLKEEALRLLRSPRATAVIDTFHRRWLQLSDVRGAGADLAAFAPLRETLLTSALLTTRALAWDSPGDQAAFFRGPLMGNRAMAEFYLLSQPSGQGFEALAPLGQQQRYGLLTLPAVLAARASGGQTSPVRRGVWVKETLLCQPVPPPPANVNNTLPRMPQPRPLTTRELMAEHTKSPACSACHSFIDGVGFGLENYDGYGRWRTTENGAAVDASWDGRGPSGDLLGERFDGPGGLAALLAKHEDFVPCLSKQWLRFAFGRDLLEEDNCIVPELKRAYLEKDGQHLRSLLLAIVTSNVFVIRAAP